MDERNANARPSPAIEELEPDLMYVRDKSGHLVPVPGFTYEDFLDLVGLKQRSEQPSAKVPDFSLQQMLISGKTGGQLAELTIRFDVRVRRSDWVQVPLALAGVALEGAAEYEGHGDHFLDYDESARQYVVWLRGSAGAEHRLTLKVRAPLTSKGSQRRLALALPRAASSKLTLQVTGTEIVASATPGDFIPEVSRGEDSSNISVLGVGGDFTLTWSAAARATAPSEPFLESNGVVLVKIDGRSVASEATLSVRGFGAEFDRFHVSLPKGAVLAGGQQPGYTLAVGPADASLVEVRFDKPTSGPIDVRLLTERAYDVAKPQTLELAGFQVVEAIAQRQGGQIGVVVSGDWQVVWENRSRVRQIDEPLETLRRRDLYAAFEYVGQPCSLAARVVPRQARVSVDPEFVYNIDAYQTQLEAHLRCSIRGAKVFSLNLEIPGWEVDEVGPASVVDVKLADAEEGGPLRIPFVQPMIGEVEIAVRAHRPHSENSKDIELQMPVVRDAIVAPATVVIMPADNVELNTLGDQLVALSPQRAPPGLRLPHGRQNSLVFRGERANAKYTGRLTVHPQKVVVEVANAAEVGHKGIDVQQRFKYQVFYEPVERLSFALPSILATEHGLSMYVNDEPVVMELIADQDGGKSVRMQVQLPEPRIGLLELTSRYHLPIEELRPATSIPLEIPLPMPLEGEFAGNTLSVNCEAGLAVESPPGHWKLIESGEPAPRQRVRLAAATAANLATLSLVVEDRPTAGTVVERGWIQTWLADRSRQERAVFQIVASQPSVAVHLPSDVNTSELEVLLDARPIRPTLKNGNGVAIEWPAGEGMHVLELRYPYAQEGGHDSSVPLDIPDFGEGVRMRRVYWQLIVPRDQHLLSASSGLNPEFSWVWDRLHWSRSSLLDQADLEAWTNTIHEPSVPESMNTYLFSVIGEGQTLRLSVVRRSTIVFAVSLIVLVVVLSALYVPWLHRPQPLIAAGAAVVVLAFAFPEPAIVLGQAAVLGVLLALAAAFLHLLMRQKTASDDLPPLQSGSVIERSSTEVLYRAPPASPSSTATAALALERPSSHSQVR